MFKGSHPITVDAKGRIAIPASYRQSLIDDCGGRMVVTQHWDGCLLLYPQPEYQKFEAQLLAKGSVDPSPLLTGVVGLEGVPAAFDALEAADRHAKILIDPTLTGAEVRPR